MVSPLTPEPQHRPTGTRTPAGGPTAGVSPGSTFAPVALRPAVDVAAVEDRLASIGRTRSTDALAERAECLRLLGRHDEALTVAEEVFRLTMFTAERSDGVAARIRRAHVLHDMGRYERAATECAMARDTARIEEWPELEGAAAEIEGWSLYELARYDDARTALKTAYDAFRAAGAPGERTRALQEAIESAMRASMSRPAAVTDDPTQAIRRAATRTERGDAER
jgi:tetratricopeptide (TPR) repeat protein